MIGSMPSDRLKVATYNAHGVRGKEYEVSQLSTRVHILSVCETWLRPQDVLQTNLFDESVSVTQSHGGWRGQGGVAVKIHPLMRYSVLSKVATEKYQLLAMSVAQTQVVSLYLSPLVPKEVFLECLNTAHKTCRGKAVIMGDFNARHRTWDRTSNSHGRWLVAWAKKHRWVIHAPSEPTFSGHRGSSTVDLVLTRSLESSEATVMHGKWDGVSDHEPVSCTLDAIAQPKLIVPAIPQKQRENSAYTEAAKIALRAEATKLR